MLRYGFIAAGNIIRAMHRGAEMNKITILLKSVSTILTRKFVRIMQQEDMLHLIT